MNLYNILLGEITQQDLLNYYNASITYIWLPKHINGCVFSYKDIYNIYINKNLSRSKVKETILHELAHMKMKQIDMLNVYWIRLKLASTGVLIYKKERSK